MPRGIRKSNKRLPPKKNIEYRGDVPPGYEIYTDAYLRGIPKHKWKHFLKRDNEWVKEWIDFYDIHRGQQEIPYLDEDFEPTGNSNI